MYYSCDTKIVEGKLMVENEVKQIKIQIDDCECKLRDLKSDKGQYHSLVYQRLIDEDKKDVENEIRKLKNLLSIKEA